MLQRTRASSGKSGHIADASISPGAILTDADERKWIVENAIHEGRFSTIYSVRKYKDYIKQYVAKIEHPNIGRLKNEIQIYDRVLTKESLSKWKREHRNEFPGVPRYVASGLLNPAMVMSTRFLIMDRYFGNFEEALKQGIVQAKCAITVAGSVLKALEYLHFNDCAHADVRAANLLYTDHYTNVTLVDLSHAHLFRSNGTHCPAKPNPKFRHHGTLEFCSRDSHNALPPSRRGDLESLLYNLIFWLARLDTRTEQPYLTGLPWGHLVTDAVPSTEVSPRVKMRIAELKEEAMHDVNQLISGANFELDRNFSDFAQAISKLGYDEAPNYKQLSFNLMILSGRVSGKLTKRSSTGRNLEANSKATSTKSSLFDEQQTDVKKRRISTSAKDVTQAGEQPTQGTNTLAHANM